MYDITRQKSRRKFYMKQNYSINIYFIVVQSISHQAVLDHLKMYSTEQHF